MFILVSFQFLILKGQKRKKTGNKVQVILVADLSVHCVTFIMNLFQLTTGYYENREFLLIHKPYLC